MKRHPIFFYLFVIILRRRQTVLIAALAAACCLSGCGKKEDRRAADAGQEEPSRVGEPVSAPVPPPESVELEMPGAVVPFGGDDLRAGARNVPYHSLPGASTILEFDDSAAELALDERTRLAEAADLFMMATIPDFVVKDAHRPWLDRQYLPVGIRIHVEPDGGLQAELSMRVLQWDEGKPTEPDLVALSLDWTGGLWLLVEAPVQFRMDLANALETLQGDWQPGERHLTRSE